MPYTIIDHTADIGIHVTGKDLKDLFAEAAYAMFDQIMDRSNLTGKQKKPISVTGIDRHDLLINWLRELLSLWTIDTDLVNQVDICDLTETHLRADIFYDAYDSGKHEILKEIKAVTYSGISVNQTKTGWEATIIFDV